MMRWLVGSSLRSRGLVLGLAAMVMTFGILQLRNRPVDVLPEFGPPTVDIRTEALGLSALEVEQLITAPMEQNLLNGVAFLDVIKSESVPGLSSIELVFERGTDLMRARQVVQERLIQAHGALPKVAKAPQMLQPLSSTSRLMMIRLSSKDMSLIDMSVLARWTIRPRLMGVPGVANVAIWGQRERQLQVQVDPERLRSQGVSLDQVIETTGNALWVSPLSFLEASTPGTGGFIDTPNQRLGLQHLLPINTPEDLAQVPLVGCTINSAFRTPTGTRHADGNCPNLPVNLPAVDPSAGPLGPDGRPIVRLGDVATVVEDHQPLIGDAVFTDGDGLMLVVEKFPEANALAVTRDVEGALDALAPGLSDLRMDPSIYRPATYIQKASENLTRSMLVGLALAGLVLLAIRRSWRAALVSLLAIATSLGAAGLVLHLRGTTLNSMVVAGLVLALVVLIDDAVVDREHLSTRLRRRSEEGEDPSWTGSVLTAALETRAPLAYATAMALLVLLPVLVLRGESGAFLPPLAISYGAAVLISMVVALTVTPALSFVLLSGVGGQAEPASVGRFRRGYERVLSRFAARPAPAYLALALTLVAGLVALPFVERGRSLVPAFKDTDLLIHWDGAPGTSLTGMKRITGRVAGELRQIDGVRNVGAHVGRAVMADQVVGSNSSEVWVSLQPTADHGATVNAIEEVVQGYPGIERAVLTYSKERIRDVMTTSDDDVTVRIYGQSFDVLRDKAEEVRAALAGVNGVVRPTVERQPEEPTLEVKVDLPAAQRAGIKPGDVRRSAAALLSGIEVGNLFEEQKVFEVVVWGAPQARRSVDDVRELLVDTPTGGHVRLGDVATVTMSPSPNVIRHESVSRSIDIGAQIRGRNVDAVVGDIERRLDQVKFPIEHHAEVVGEHAERRAGQRRLLGVGAVAALAILLLMQVAFGSWRLAIVISLALPMALVGGLVAASLDGDALSVGSLTGFAALLALAARNAVMFVGRCRGRRDHEGHPFGPELVRQVAGERVLAVVTGALASAAALLPVVILGSIPGQEVVHPMAMVVLGGLVTSTLFSLFAAPALYLHFGSDTEPSTPGMATIRSAPTGLPAPAGRG